jgi:BlaI family penicillinase repressor
VSDAELEVLKALWDLGAATVRQVEALLRRRRRRWAYTTVLTLLSRLRDKGYVASEKPERSEKSDKAERGERGGAGASALVFRAIVTREQVLREGLSDLADRVCDGTASPLVHALVQGHKFTAEDIAHFRKLLDDLEGKG